MGLDQRLSIAHEDKEVWVQDFRKVNFLHRWIEQNCNEGHSTNCDDIPLNLEQIAGLEQACEAVLATPEMAPLMLPTQEGFFFGSYEYDEYYFDDVRDVLRACREILAQGYIHHAHGGAPFTITYWSWW
jgi:hypothetical protein